MRKLGPHVGVAVAAFLTTGCLALSGCTSASPREALSTTASSRSTASSSRPDPGPTPTAATRSPSTGPSVPSTQSPISAARLARGMTVAGGALLRAVTIRSSHGFAARAAYVYVPAAVRRDPRLHTPVVELLHGTPGSPVDWILKGGLVHIMASFAARHSGRAPLVVIPDLNGTERGDSECIRTISGQDVESYLVADVVNWMRTQYRAAIGSEKFWIAGLSEGGLCSLMLALRHPQVYSAFGDFSGLAVPSVEGHSQAQSDVILYGHDTGDRLAHQPLWLLAHRHYRGLRGWFECGAQDRQVLAAQKQLVAATPRTGLVVHAAVVPGQHSWAVWQASLSSTLIWLWPAG